MKKRNLMLLSAIAAASILMTGCGFTADDPADSQAVTITPEPVEATATPAPTSTPAPTVTPAANLTTTPAPAAADGTAASTDGTAASGGENRFRGNQARLGRRRNQSHLRAGAHGIGKNQIRGRIGRKDRRGNHLRGLAPNISWDGHRNR